MQYWISRCLNLIIISLSRFLPLCAVEAALQVTIGSSLASGLVKSLLHKSANLLSESSSAAGLNKSVLFGNLKRELEKLDGLLCSAERLTPAHHNRNALLLQWLGRVNKAANFTDNFLDDISYEQIRRQAESNTVSNFSLPYSVDIKIGRKLNTCISMVAKLYKEATKIGLQPVELVDTSFVVGRQVEEELIVGELCRPNNDQLLRVIAIIGKSGVGKTTLARKIYDNETVTEQYKNKVWITVADNLNLRSLLDEMLQSLTGVSHDISSTDAMEKKLNSSLQKGRYLLILNDVWNTKKQVWDSIRTSLVRVADGCTGTSMVLVTTQLQEVASVMGASLTHEVKILSKYDSMVLFERKAYANKSSKQASDLSAIGKIILNKCGGLPLAINTLASLLATMNERSEWESVDRSQVWNLLNFNHLSNAAIKQCFAHCSILIPKGEDVSEGYLISSWFAQGLIQLSETSDQDMMAIGRAYIMSMRGLGLLQLYSDKGYYQRFTMPDLIHDFAVYVSGNTYLSIREPGNLHKASSGVEHVLIHGGNTFNSQLYFPKRNAHSTLRTLICRQAAVSIDYLVVRARLLCQLDLIDCGLKEIPRSIGRLKHLRRLYIKDNLITCLPDSVGSLYNLQVLTLLGCDRLFQLPQQVTKLLNLRWIATTEAVHIPKGLGQLTRLTKLPLFKVEAGDGCRIKELGSLKNLVDIRFKQLENISCKEDALGADLKTKEGIDCLQLEWSSEGNEGDIICTNDEEVMEGLQPHSNLKVLWVENFRANRFSLWLSSGNCNNLTDLTLLNCKRCEQMPTLGCLPYLEYLRIDGMGSVEVIGSDFFACSSIGNQGNLFPRLNKLLLWNMPKLKEWFDPSGLCASAFPCLLILNISDCPTLVSVPSCFHSLEMLFFIGVNSSEPLLSILNNSNKLTDLEVENVQQLTCLPEPLLKCTSLQCLKIKGCKELVELTPTLQSLTCLKTLFVEDCDSLTSLPDIEGLLSLKILKICRCEQITDTPCGLESCVSIEKLTVVNCHKLNFNPDLAISSHLRDLNFYDLSKQVSVPQWLNHLYNLTITVIGGFNNMLDNIRGIEHLPKSLKSLTLVGWLKLKSLPEELQSFTQLETLGLREFDGVTELPEWLGNLSSLQSLELLNCKNMKHLPSLEAMRRLTRLGELKIKECPLLEERCRKEGGEEWPKISHLPHIHINEVEVSKSDNCLADDGTRSQSRLTVARDALPGWVKRRVGLADSQ